MSNVKATIEDVKKKKEDAFENVKYPEDDDDILHPQEYVDADFEDF